MLQKGFLKPKEDPKKSGAFKKGRLCMFAGIMVIFLSLLYIMTNLQQAVLSLKGWLFVLIVGFCLALVGFWLNFFAQNKNRR